MKIRIIILLFTLADIIYVTGCTKDKTSSLAPAASLVGKWKVVSDTTTHYISGEATTEIFTLPDAVKTYFTFNADGTAYSNLLSGITYTLNDKILTINYPDYGTGSTGVPAHSVTTQIRPLTDTRLVIFTDLTTKDTDGKLNGNTVTELEVKVPAN